MSHPRRRSMVVDDFEQSLVEGSLDEVVKLNEDHPHIDNMCHKSGCVFSKGHHIKHSWEYTKGASGEQSQVL